MEEERNLITIQVKELAVIAQIKQACLVDAATTLAKPMAYKIQRHREECLINYNNFVSILKLLASIRFHSNNNALPRDKARRHKFKIPMRVARSCLEKLKFPAPELNNPFSITDQGLVKLPESSNV